MIENCFRLLVSVFLLMACLTVQPVSATVIKDPFPVYDSMKANVAFWEVVYAKYPTTTGLIHDNRQLDIVYEIVSLRPWDEPGARRHNKKKIKKVKEKYKHILLSFAAGNRPKTKEEKRVRALFGKNVSSGQLKKFASSIRFQLCQKDRFEQGVIRSGKYLAEMKKIFRRYGLPEGLAYLPHVESSFNYKAYSKFGAAGVWQFTRSTGKRFMTVDYTLDERRDPIQATHAAAKFLKENYQKLGSWPLALTAYNHGPNGMLRAKKKFGDYDTIFNKYDGKRFGFASRNFYSEYIAARKVAKNYKKHFGAIKLDKPVATFEVVLPNYAPVENISRFFHVDLSSLQELNPALRPPVFQGRKYIPKGYRLRLPGKNGSMARLARAMPANLFVAKQKRSRFYRVQKGDTAGVIARRHGVKLQDLLLANGLNRRATIYAGQNLRIPSLEEKVVRVAQAARGDSGRQPALIKNTSPKKKPAQPVVTKAQPKAGPVITLTPATTKKEAVVGQVASLSWSERVSEVTAKLSIQEMQESAHLSPAAKQQKKQVAAPASIAVAGEEMESEPEGKPNPMEKTVVAEHEAQLETETVLDTLPQVDFGGDDSLSVVVGNLLVEGVRVVKGRTVGTIRVAVGETLGHYADWLQIPTRVIRTLNGLPFGKAIQLNQFLKIEFSKVSQQDFEGSRYEFHKEIEEDFFAAYKIEGAKLYRIQPGDNIWRLCHDEFDLPLWLIQKFNTVHDFSNLKLDELLIIPVVRKVEE